jgi:sentrin-specific protease 1
MNRLLSESKDLPGEQFYDYNKVRRWTKKINIANCEKVFLPINVGNWHWILGIVLLKKKEIIICDSMHNESRIPSYLNYIMRWVKDLFWDKFQLEIDEKDWSKNDLKKQVPQQKDGFNCGVFTIMYADFYSDDLPYMSFGQEHMKRFRVNIGAAIIRGKLLY